MAKRGVISLEALVKFIPVLLIAIVGLSVLFTLWGVFWKEEMSAAQYDMQRVVQNLKTLAPGESIEVFTRANDARLVLYGKLSESAESSCAGETCICVYEPKDGAFAVTKCEAFPEIKKECPKSTDEKALCFPGSPEEVRIFNGKADDKLVSTVVKICRTDGRISIKC